MPSEVAGRRAPGSNYCGRPRSQHTPGESRVGWKEDGQNLTVDLIETREQLKNESDDRQADYHFCDRTHLPSGQRADPVPLPVERLTNQQHRQDE